MEAGQVERWRKRVRLCFPFVAFITGCHYLFVWLFS